MSDQALLRIVRNMLSPVVELVDSSGDETQIPALLRNVRDGVAGFCSLLDGVIDEAELEEIVYDTGPGE